MSVRWCVSVFDRGSEQLVTAVPLRDVTDEMVRSAFGAPSFAIGGFEVGEEHLPFVLDHSGVHIDLPEQVAFVELEDDPE